MAYLRSLDDQIQIHIEEGQNLLLGRLLKCDVVIDDGSVSSQHARLQLLNHQLRVVDMGSTNGSRINYSLLDGVGYLLDGDTVEFGNVSFIVDGPELEAPLDATQMEGLPDLHPLESSQKLSDTMLNIALPTDDELEDSDVDVQTELQPVDGDGPADEQEGRIIEINPLLYGFLVALMLLLLAGGLLLAHLHQAFPPSTNAVSVPELLLPAE